MFWLHAVFYMWFKWCLIHLDIYLVFKVSSSAKLIIMISHDIHNELFLTNIQNWKFILHQMGWWSPSDCTHNLQYMICMIVSSIVINQLSAGADPGFQKGGWMADHIYWGVVEKMPWLKKLETIFLVLVYAGFFNFQIQSRCCTTVMLLVLQYKCFIGPIQSWSREADIKRLGWIAMDLLYTLPRSIWILWQCMAITARSDSLSVVILLLNHVWILLTQENDLSASGNEVAIKPEHRLSTWVGKRERFPTNFAIMSQSESYFTSLGVVKWLPCELLREKWRQTTKRGVTTTRHERELIFLSLFIFYFK